jgi:hypothetical protein
MLSAADAPKAIRARLRTVGGSCTQTQLVFWLGAQNVGSRTARALIDQLVDDQVLVRAGTGPTAKISLGPVEEPPRPAPPPPSAPTTEPPPPAPDTLTPEAPSTEPPPAPRSERRSSKRRAPKVGETASCGHCRESFVVQQLGDRYCSPACRTDGWSSAHADLGVTGGRW